jgi:EAL domain-containing protein (putative c-di-GMP-specific phosphodiesterase class I)
LRPANRGSHRIRIAANTFETLVKQFDGQIFVLQQGDIVFICKAENVIAADEAVTKVRFLFGDDPLVGQGEEPEDSFATWYDLGVDFAKFFAYVDQQSREEERRRKRIAQLTGAGLGNERLPMDPAGLAELATVLARADLSNVLRRQPICAILPNQPPKPLYRELYVSIADLREAVMPKREIASDPWLFQYLTQLLDKRVLVLLRKADDSTLAHSYSLNLNVATLLSPEFLAFDSNLRAGARGTIVIEIQKHDIFADLGAYLFARDFARERGYRICLDGLTRLTLPFIDRARLGLDLVKMFWTPDIAEGEGSERTQEFMEAIERIGKSSIILARCDTEDAITLGQKIGLRLFQGRAVDKLLSVNAIPALTRNKLAPPPSAASR